MGKTASPRAFPSPLREGVRVRVSISGANKGYETASSNAETTICLENISVLRE